MKSVIKFKFNTAIHYGNSGKPGLLDSDISILSDTLYSALIANNPNILNDILKYVKEESLRISDMLPYVDNNLLVKRSLRSFNFDGDLEIDRTLYKVMKKIEFISLNKINEYYNSCTEHLIKETYENQKRIGNFYIQTRNKLPRNAEDTMPYTLTNFNFNNGSGLYIVVEHKNQKILDFLIEELISLGLSGIGGRKSSGLGKFEILEIFEYKEKEEGRHLLMSTIIPNSNVDDVQFDIIKRSGFYHSNRGDFKKRDIYAIRSGILVNNKIEGMILDNLSKDDEIFRILMPLYVRV